MPAAVAKLNVRTLGLLPVALVLAVALLFFSPASQATSCPLNAPSTCLTGQGDWSSTLLARSFDGGATIGGYFDTVLNITWLADANRAATSGFDLGGVNNPAGTLNFTGANAWANGLNINGIVGWRLPTLIDSGGVGCSNLSFAGGTDCGYNVQSAPGTFAPTGNQSEMGHMFYVTLANRGAFGTNGLPQSGSGLTNSGPFANLMNTFYWTNKADDGVGVAETCVGGCGWYFDFADGSQFYDSQVDEISQFAWAVHNGDVGTGFDVVPVPLPASAWLLLSGLLGMVMLSRRRRHECGDLH